MIRAHVALPPSPDPHPDIEYTALLPTTTKKEAAPVQRRFREFSVIPRP
jgi:hypothetical protein